MAVQRLASRQYEFDDATEAIEFYFRQGWTDGLPVIPPTVERVQQFLDRAGLSPSDIIGTEPTKGRVITAEKVAINAVMAGCLPEYFPVVVAAVEAMCEPQFNLHAISVSTMGAAVLLVVNGPIAKDLRLNSGVSVFGPGHRANATIGRAIRLVLCNITGAIPGVLDKATLGHPGKYSFCIAEAEEVSPWEPLHIERGIRPGRSAVSIFAGLSPIQVTNHEGHRPEQVLTSFRDALFAVGMDQGELVVVLSPEHVGHIKAADWSKRQVKEYLFQTAQRRVSDWTRAGRAAGPLRGEESKVLKGVVRSPDSITIVVAGGAAGGFSAIIPLWGGGSNSRSVTREIKA